MIRNSTILCIALAISAPAQGSADRAVIATDVGGATVLLDVDLTTGSQSLFGAFADQTRRPLAVVWDAIDDRAVVAVDLGGGRSRIVRVGRVSRPFDRVIADLNGRVTDLGLGYRGDVIATVNGTAGGVYRVPRHGGNPTLAIALPHAEAQFAPGYVNYAFVVADPPGAGALLVGADIDAGSVFQGPVAVPTPAGATITGVADLPTGAWRQVISDSAGNLGLFEFSSAWTPLSLQPPQPGGIAALELISGYSIDVAILGDAAHPFLERVVVFGPGVGTRSPLAGPLPGAPVDFSIANPELTATIRFGRSCSPTQREPEWTSNGVPRIGAAFAIELRSLYRNTVAIAAIGFDEQRWALGPLPFALPNGCGLLIDPAIGFGRMTDATGFASLALSIPNDPNLPGLVAYGQWIVDAELATTDAVAIRIGR